MRAVVQGVDTRQSWNRYLRSEGEHDDIRNIQRTIRWIRDEFAAAARRHQRHGLARLVRVDPAQVRDDAVPSLEEFAADQGLLDFSEAEQLEYYQERYGGATARQSRRARLVARQLDALNWLEQVVGAPPQANDPVAAWLNPDLARHLQTAGILTLCDLAARINGVGLRWWQSVRAVGAVKGERIVAWLKAHEATTGLVLGEHVHMKRSVVPAATLRRVVQEGIAIVPLEKLVLPPHLSGVTGAFRAPAHACHIRAANDRDALLAWVRSKAKQAPDTEGQTDGSHDSGIGTDDARSLPSRLSNTQRTYLKEAERFMLWAVIELGKPLSSITADDCHAYVCFLAGPAPADKWCGPRGREKWSPLWRPFEGALSPRAQRHAVVILRNLFQFLVDQGYLVHNPWHTAHVPLVPNGTNRAHRFSPEQWAFIVRQLEALPVTSVNRRLVAAIHLIHATGLRLSEAVAVRLDHLQVTGQGRGGEAEQQWTLVVESKRGQTHYHVLPPEVTNVLTSYLSSRGFDPDPQSPQRQGAYLLGKATDMPVRAPWLCSRQGGDARSGITPGVLYRQIKAFFGECASRLEARDPQGTQLLARASTYWLRHTRVAEDSMTPR